MSNLPIVREESAFELGKVFAESGMFPNIRKQAEAVVKIIAGKEFGLGPLAAMNGIHMVDGKPTLAANLIAGQIKRHPRYDYKVIRRDEDGCELEFHDQGYAVGRMTFDKRDAERAGLLGKQNWKKYPRDMYFARCLTAGARTYCPDVLGGSPIYTAEELGADGAETPQEPVSRPSTPTPDVSPVMTFDGERHYDIPDAEVVPAGDETVNADTLKQLRATYDASGHTDNELCWFLLSVGVESLPEDPSKQDIAKAMRSLTVDQALRLEALMQGEDDSVPGSGEAA